MDIAGATLHNTCRALPCPHPVSLYLPCTCICTCMRMCVHRCKCTCICACGCICQVGCRGMHATLSTPMSDHPHPEHERLCAMQRSTSYGAVAQTLAHTRACLHACMHARTHARARAHVHTFTRNLVRRVLLVDLGMCCCIVPRWPLMWLIEPKPAEAVVAILRLGPGRHQNSITSSCG